MKQELINKAEKAAEHAYAPYSKFKVGAALLCSDGTVYTGANIENASYSMTVCAERVAFSKAVFDKKRDFTAIAVVSINGDTVNKSCIPCGACLQFMSEFCKPDFKFYREKDGEFETVTLKDLFPNVFYIK